MQRHALTAMTAGLCLAVLPAATAAADTFNGRIAFSSFRSDPAGRVGDIFSIDPDRSALKQLTTNPADDAQSDWAPDGRDIAYRIRRPGSASGFEVARMTAHGTGHTPLTDSPGGPSSSQPSWFPDRTGIMFRRSEGQLASIWTMTPLGNDEALFLDPPNAQLYPSFSPDMSRVLMATRMSAPADTDRAVQVINRDGTGLTTLFDVVGAYDSGPGWSPDGERIAFESNADVAGGNPERDLEIWIMDADGGNPTQITRNAIHDEGPAWSPDGTMLAYSSGLDDLHLDINVMTSTGMHLRTLTDYPGRDESPDWQAIPAPDTDRRCGDLVDSDPSIRDVRAAGPGMGCKQALRTAERWPERHGPYEAEEEDFGGVTRVVLTHHGAAGRLVTFLVQP